MLIRKEITSSISTLEIEIEENLNKQEAVKQSYEGTLAELEESKAAKEEEKKASKKPLFAKLTRKGKAYLARMAQLEADIQDLQSQIDNLYTSDEEYVALTAGYDTMCEKLAELNEQLRECIFKVITVKEEVASRLAELEVEMQENLNKQEAIKQSYEGTLAELEESKAAKEEEKKASKKPLFAKLTRKGKAYLARMAQLDADIQDVQNQIDNLYTSDKEYVALTAEYDLMCEELVHLNEQMTECIFIEKLDKNRVYIYGTGYAESDNVQIVIDGERLGDFASPIGIYPLSEGDHTLYIVRDYEMTKTIHFTLNGNNKFVYFEMERYAINNTVYQKMQRCEASYKSNVSDGFYEFVEENKLCDCTAQKIRNYVLDL